MGANELLPYPNEAEFPPPGVVDDRVWDEVCDSQIAAVSRRRFKSGENTAAETLRVIRNILYFEQGKSVLPREVLRRVRLQIGVAEAAGVVPSLP